MLCIRIRNSKYMQFLMDVFEGNGHFENESLTLRPCLTLRTLRYVLSMYSLVQ